MKSRTCLASLCLMLVSTFAFSQTPATFSTQTYPADAPFQFTYAVDVNNDGVLDVIQDVYGVTAGFAVKIANGDGTFRVSSEHTFPNPRPQGVVPMVAADVNNDGKVDLVFASGGDQRLFVYLGNGDGTFQPPKVITAVLPAGWHFGGEPVVAADFNRDGKIDIATEANNTTLSTLYVFPGDGTGNFGAPHLVESAPVDRSIGVDLVVGDFDADGKADLASQSTAACNPGPCNSQIHVNYGNGAFGFTNTVPFSSATFFNIQAGDVNQDGHTDLFGPMGSNLTVLYGQTNRTFSAQSTPMAQPSTEMRMADFNGDGTNDLVGSFGNNMVFMLQNGTGGFTEQTFPFSSSTFQHTGVAIVGDFNKDLKPDAAAIAEKFDNTAALYELVNTTTGGSFSANCSYPKSGQGIHLCVTPGTPNDLGGFVASANSFGVLRKMELWVDGKKIAEQFHAWGDHRAWFSLGVSPNFPGPGTHNATMFAVDVDNRLQHVNFTYTVGSSTCTQPASATATVICSPANGSTVTSPVSVQARGGSSVNFMEVWVDGTKRFQTSGNTVNTSLTLAAGGHRLTVFGKNGSTVLSSAASDFTVH